ncbi:MAG: trypsin-like peptidase domain-containing protein [Burkholderiaceae bacterium]|nr:trypsin-like peptidase domain-containing protein [Burkholderiaceae bacterium]
MNRVVAFVVQTAAAGLLAFGLLSWIRPAAPALEPARASEPALAVRPAPPPAASAPALAVRADHASYRAAVRAAMPSVVNIYTAKAVPRNRGWSFGPPSDYGEGAPARATSLGSGVVWRTDGYVVTNNHVVEGADEIAVVLNGRAPLPARVVGTDPESDLAVLKLDVTGLPAIERGSSSHLDVGDVVLAIGNPFGVGQTVTQGIVSATGRNHLGINTFENFIQTDAAINPGNSGGALVDTAGRLAGINTAIYTRSEGSIGIGFAIPVELVASVADELIAGGRVRRGYLGIQTQDLDAELASRLGVAATAGVLVAAVEANGPAQRGGLRPGDVIRSIGGKAVADAAELVSRTGNAKPGDSVNLQIERRGQRSALDIKLGQRPALRRVQQRDER